MTSVYSETFTKTLIGEKVGSGAIAGCCGGGVDRASSEQVKTLLLKDLAEKPAPKAAVSNFAVRS